MSNSKKTDWSESKENKLVALKGKKRKKCHTNHSCRPKVGSNFSKFLRICQDAQEELSFFELTTFSLKLTLYFHKTNSHSNLFFFELDTTRSPEMSEVTFFGVQIQSGSIDLNFNSNLTPRIFSKP